MGMLDKARSLARLFKQEVKVYARVARHPRTPRAARWLLVLAVAYALSPIDLIPDFIPVIGHLDDLIIIPVLVWLALKLIPKDVVEECRRQVLAADEPQPTEGAKTHPAGGR